MIAIVCLALVLLEDLVFFGVSMIQLVWEYEMLRRSNNRARKDGRL